MIVNVHEVKTHLSRLLEQVEAREEVIVAAGGLSKDDVRRYVFDEARVPRHIWERGGMAKMVDDPFAAEPSVPIISRPDDLIIIVVGGFGRHSSWLPTFGASTQAVTRPIISA